MWTKWWIKMNERMTVKNPNGTYRIPIHRAGEFIIESIGQSMAIRGQLVDRLGKYEEIGLSPEEIERMVKNGNIK